MSHATIDQATRDEALQARVQAAAMQEAIANLELAATPFGQQLRRNPMLGLNQFLWPTAVEYEDAYAYALNLDPPNPNPGGDETVITDANITAVVQAWWPPSPAAEPQVPIAPLAP